MEPVFDKIIVCVIIHLMWVKLLYDVLEILTKLRLGFTNTVITLQLVPGTDQGLFIFSKMILATIWVNFDFFVTYFRSIFVDITFYNSQGYNKIS